MYSKASMIGTFIQRFKTTPKTSMVRQFVGGAMVTNMAVGTLSFYDKVYKDGKNDIQPGKLCAFVMGYMGILAHLAPNPATALFAGGIIGALAGDYPPTDVVHQILHYSKKAEGAAYKNAF